MSAAAFPVAGKPRRHLRRCSLTSHSDLAAGSMADALGQCVGEVRKPLRESRGQWLSKDMFIEPLIIFAISPSCQDLLHQSSHFWAPRISYSLSFLFFILFLLPHSLETYSSFPLKRKKKKHTKSLLSSAPTLACVRCLCPITVEPFRGSVCACLAPPLLQTVPQRSPSLPCCDIRCTH